MGDSAKAKPKQRSLGTDLSGRRLGRYEVLSMLASGGMATVYIARAQGVAGFERLVAIKVLHPHLAHDDEFISMFLDEARLAARLRHPNAVGTLDISDSEGDGFFLVMEYVEGDHLGALLKAAARARERLPVPVVARILMDSLTGLMAAHELKDASGARLELVHRDVSPHNILVSVDGVARITDFGVAKAQVRLSSTRDGQFKGKLSYMAPEQAASGQADQRSDLFSMGIVLWESLTGRRLFRGENNAEVLNKILDPQVPPPSKFDENLVHFDKVIEKALSREPDERFQSAEEFLEAVEQAANATGEGVASSRTVAREVERWLSDKIARERNAIKSAIEALGPSEVSVDVPRPRDVSNPNMRAFAAERQTYNDDATLAAKPSTRMGTPEVHAPKSKRNWMIAAVFLLFLIIGVAAAITLMLPGSPPPPLEAGPTEERLGDAPPRSTPAVTSRVPTPPVPAAAATENIVEPPSEASPSATDGVPSERTETQDAIERDTESDEARDRRRRRRERRRALDTSEAQDHSDEPQGGAPENAQNSDNARPNSGTTSPNETRTSSPPAEDDLLLNPYRN